MNDQYRQESALQEKQQAISEGGAIASQVAVASEEQTYKNHKFLGELRNAGLDEDMTADLGPRLAGSHVTAFREPESYEQRISWGNENDAERDIIRNDPGLHVRRRPTMMAIAQDVHRREDRDAERPPMTSDERADRREAATAVTNFQSLGKGGKGIDTVGTVQTSVETHTTEEEQRMRDKVSERFSR
jgi:hypothetical protein